MSKEIIYIAGLGHSGSTILDMALGSHLGITGLGEICSVFNSKDPANLYENSTCSCGEKGKNCSFWKDVRSFSNSDVAVIEKYTKLIELFSQKYGDNMILLDSSKNSYSFLKDLNENYNLKILYLTRDFRSWVYSRFYRTKKPLFYLAIRWYLENRKLLFVLNRMKLNTFKIGYEELAIFPEFMFEKISNYLNIEYCEEMISPLNTKSHIISGNIARTDNLKKTRFYYDPRWLLSTRMIFISGLFFFFQRLNKKLVYSNITEGKAGVFGKRISDFHIFGKKRTEQLDNEHN